jgi:hemoglobin
MLKDIQTKEDITLLVNTFYGKVLNDEQLAPFFKRLNFESHLPKMIHFWSFALLDEPGYTTNVTDKHLQMPLKKIHFDQWLFLFNETINQFFIGKKAEMAKQRAAVIAWTINSKLSK